MAVNVGDIVYREGDNIDCDSGPPYNKIGIVVEISKIEITVFWPDEHNGYIMKYGKNSQLEVINEGWRQSSTQST